MIIDFINNVQPDMSYGTSDGMTRAMVESAENMAVVNDYITESTYEVYTEAKYKNLKDKFTKFYAVFMYIIKKAIEKVKGFFLSIKRKLTIAMAKALKILGKKIIINKNNNAQKTKNDLDETSMNTKKLNTYTFDTEKYNKLCDFINSSMNALSDIKKSLNNGHNKIKDEFTKFINNKNDTGSVLLTKITYKITLGKSNEYLTKKIKEIFKDVDTIMKEFYNHIIKSFDNTILELKKAEKETKEDMIIPETIKTRFNIISNAIHIANYIKYRSSQLVASACLKMYKKSFSEAIKISDHVGYGKVVEPLDPTKRMEEARKHVESTKKDMAEMDLKRSKERKKIQDELNKYEWYRNANNKSNNNKKGKVIKTSYKDDLNTVKSKIDSTGKDDILEL